MKTWKIWPCVAVLTLSACANLVQPKQGTSSKPHPPKHSVLHIKKPVPFATDETIKPTAIVLHWSDGWGDIDGLISGLRGNKTNFGWNKAGEPSPLPTTGNTSVQIGVTPQGEAWRLTKRTDSFARHATCANKWAIGIEIIGSGPGSKHYIGSNSTQFKAVVKVVKELMATYGIPAVSTVNSGARSGKGIVSHHMVDAKCTWYNGNSAGSGKTDVDDSYLKRVLAAVK